MPKKTIDNKKLLVIHEKTIEFLNIKTDNNYLTDFHKNGFLENCN